MARRFTQNDARLALWSMAQYNRAQDEYRAAVHHYLRYSDNWEQVQSARRNALYTGSSEETLLEIDLEEQNDPALDDDIIRIVMGEE